MKTGYLLALAAHLERIEATPPNKRRRKFSINTVFRRGQTPCTRANRCGAVACAMGEAAFVPMLRDKGGLALGRLHELTLDGERIDYVNAAQRLFCIDQETAHHLFSPAVDPDYNDPTPGQVAARIRSVVAAHKAAA